MQPHAQGLTDDAPRLSWARYGEQGPPVLMVMGFGMAGIMWRNQVQGLHSDHQVVTFDHRGIGASDPCHRWYDMATLGDDVLRVADALQWDRFHLVGVSMGGMVAQHTALAAPERLHSLSLLITQGGGRLAWLPPARGLAVIASLARQRTPRGRARTLAKLLYTDKAADTVPPERMAQRERDLLAHPPARGTVLRQLRAVMRHHTLDRLHDLCTPTLVVQAAHDRLVHPRHSEVLASRLPHARLVRVGTAGHGLVVESADAVNDALRAHVRDHHPS